jgi:ElaB/YqjD/DUF883 family membrane-anchored ribosome-binding protein
MTDKTMGRAEHAVDEAISAARNMKNEAGDMIASYQEDLVASARDKPLATLGVAIVIGFLIGAVWKS